MTNQEYHSKKEYLSKSALDQIHKSPAHFKAYMEGEKQPPTPAMIFGTLVHSLVFNQNDFAVIPQCDRRTTEGKAIYAKFLEESVGKVHVTADQYSEACKIRDAVYNHPAAAALLKKGNPEVSIFGELNGLPCRCRVDWQSERGYLVDLKTTNSASPEEFSKSVWNYRYHVQAAFYLDMTKAEKFFFIAVEKEAPYNVECYELDNEAILTGRAEYLADMELYKKCKASGNWYAYNEDKDISIISLPKWATKF